MQFQSRPRCCNQRADRIGLPVLYLLTFHGAFPLDAESDNPRTRRRAAMRRRVFVCATSGHLFMRRTPCLTYSEFSL